MPKRLPLSFTIILTTVVLFLGACDNGKNKQAPKPPPPKVVLSEVVAKTVPIIADQSGTVKAFQTVAITPRVSGFIEQRLFTEGAEVTAGTLLYIIDPRPFQAQLDAAKAKLDVNQVQAAFHKKEYARYNKLAGSGSVSKERRDTSLTNLNKFNALVEQNNADIRQAELDLEFSRITAPFDGRIQETNVYKGSVVTAQETQLTQLINLEQVYAIYNISRRGFYHFQQLKKQGLTSGKYQDVTASFDLPDGEQSGNIGHLDYISTQIDPSTDTFKSRVIFDNPKNDKGDRILIPGQYVSLHLTVGHRPNSMLIPQTALMETQEGHFVYTVGKDNKVKKQLVEIGDIYQNYQIIVKGLKIGEQVVSQGVQKIRKSGMTIQPITKKTNK